MKGHMLYYSRLFDHCKLGNFVGSSPEPAACSCFSQARSSVVCREGRRNTPGYRLKVLAQSRGQNFCCLSLEGGWGHEDWTLLAVRKVSVSSLDSAPYRWRALGRWVSGYHVKQISSVTCMSRSPEALWSERPDSRWPIPFTSISSPFSFFSRSLMSDILMGQSDAQT